MTKMNKEKKFNGPWKQIHTAIWLIGLAILAISDNWWPGILVLVAVSMIAQAAIQLVVAGSIEDEQQPSTPEIVPSSMEPLPQTPESGTSRPTHRLPAECPKCGGPIRGREVEWTGPDSADCPYCGANLPLSQ